MSVEDCMSVRRGGLAFLMNMFWGMTGVAVSIRQQGTHVESNLEQQAVQIFVQLHEEDGDECTHQTNKDPCDSTQLPSWAYQGHTRAGGK